LAHVLAKFGSTAADQAEMAKPLRQRHQLSAFVLMEAPLEALFERARHASDDEGWRTDTSFAWLEGERKDLSFAWRKAEAGKGRQLRTQCLEKTRDMHSLLHPEVLFHPQVGVLYEGVEECGIERLIAPGDADVWERLPVETGLSTLLTVLVGNASDRFRPTRGPAHNTDSLSEMMRYRTSVRRDFPMQGDYTIVHTPRHPDTGEILFQWGDASALVFHIRPTGEQGMCVLTLLEEVAPMPTWTPKLLSSKIVECHRRSSCEMANMLPRFFESAAVERISSDSSYVIASLRKCCRGGPLLPLVTGIENQPLGEWEQFNIRPLVTGIENQPLGEWEQFNIRVRHVSLYFNEFLRRLGVLEPIFFDSLHGRRLVRFQAVVQRCAWERIKSSFEEKFREQKSAFRRFIGGRVAPEIHFGAEPRFLTPPSVNTGLSAEDWLSEAPSPRGPPSRDLSPVRSTSVHSRNDPIPTGTARARSSSR